MNKEWSELNKTIQTQLKKKESFNDGIDNLIKLRASLMNAMLSFKTEIGREEFNAIPFINANGYHSKTIAYSIWHIFRIEDIVAHTLIQEDEEVFFSENYKERIKTPIISTGNELKGMEIAEFSQKLDIDELYSYILEVSKSTEAYLKSIQFADLKRKMEEKDKERLLNMNVVNPDEKAIWLVDYWCNKDVKGLIQMPFSRHWIMHVEACLRIYNRINPLKM